MKLKFDFSFMDARVIGGNGVDLAQIDNEKISAAFETVKQNVSKGDMAWTDLPDDKQIAEVAAFAQRISKSADSFVVCGIGGSALGSLCCARALLNLNHNELPKRVRRAPKLYVEDNIDAERFHALLDVVNLKNTYFNFVTKSGATTETITQFLIIYDILKRKIGAEANSRVIITTTLNHGALFDFANTNGIKVFGIPKGVGGRFSVFSPVGLVPLACLGLDTKAFIRGANYMAGSCLNANIKENPALMSAYLMYCQLKAGKTVSVMMPYAESLKYTADFYAQLWGESLSKAYDIHGNKVNSGQTPVRVLGTTDQHSQLQLFCDGPYDKVITFIRVENFRKRLRVPAPDSALSGFSYMADKDVSQILNASQSATAFTLAKEGRANFTISLPYVCEYTVGQLLCYFMYQTAYMGVFMEINAFDQPAVEHIKKAAGALMGKGDLQILEEINNFCLNPFIIGG